MTTQTPTKKKTATKKKPATKMPDLYPKLKAMAAANPFPPRPKRTVEDVLELIARYQGWIFDTIPADDMHRGSEFINKDFEGSLGLYFDTLQPEDILAILKNQGNHAFFKLYVLRYCQREKIAIPQHVKNGVDEQVQSTVAMSFLTGRGYFKRHPVL